MSASIYVIEDSIAQLFAMRDDVTSKEELEAIDAQIEAWAAAEVAKVDGVRAWLKHCKMMAAAAKEEKETAAGLEKLWNAREERMADFVVLAMERAGKTKIEGKTGALTVQGNGGKRPLEISDYSLLPEEFHTFTYTLDHAQWREVGKWFAAVLGAPKASIDNEKLRAALERPCDTCGGTGGVESEPDLDGAPGPMESCPDCGGDGLTRLPGARLLARGVHLRVK